MKHFAAESVSKRTIQGILKPGATERKSGSQKVVIMINEKKKSYRNFLSIKGTLIRTTQQKI